MTFQINLRDVQNSPIDEMKVNDRSDKCGFKSICKTVLRIVDPGNAICTRCQKYIINDTGFCPDCHGTTKKRWKQVKIKIRGY